MKKAIVLIVSFVVLSVLFLFVGYLNSHGNPFDPNIYLDYPQFSIVDEKNNIYIIDTSLRRILVADENGNLLSKISGGDRTEGGLYYARNITAGSNDNFFVLNYVLDDYGMFLLREEIVEYSLSGTFQRIVYQRVYNEKKATLVQRGEIFNPTVIEGYLYFFLVDEARIRMIRRSLRSDSTEIISNIEMDDAIAYIADIEWIGFDNFLILDKRGYLTKGNVLGELHTVYYQPEAQPDEVGNATEIGQRSDTLPREYFSDISISGDGNAYITDLINRQIISIPIAAIDNVAQSPDTDTESAKSVVYRSVLNKGILEQFGIADATYIYYRVGHSPAGFATTYDFGVYLGGSEDTFQSFESFIVPTSWILTSFIRWLGIILGSISLLTLVCYVYFKVWRRRLSIIVKQALVIVPLMVGGIILMSNILLQSYISQYETASTDKLLSLTQVISQNVDGDRFRGIRDLGDYMNEDYRFIRDSLQGSLNYNSDSWNEGLYFALYQVVDEGLYGFMYLNNEIGLRHPFTWYDDPQSVYRSAYAGSVVFEQAEDISGNFLYAIAPIYNSQNEPVALLEVGSDLFSFQQNARAIYNRASFFMLLIGLVVIIFIMIMTYIILRNLEILRKGVEQIAEGDWSYTINVKSNDELSELGDRFNHMSNSINTHLEQIAILNKSYQKFFPEQFLQHLDIESVTEVKLGDQVRRKMSILFSDIRSFTSISEKLTPEQTFNFLNNYLSMVGPIIRNNEGFIDKFIGDAVMALFPTSASDAIKTGITMLGNIREFNNKEREKGLPEVNIGIGIHTGSLMLGILGDQQRMEGTVIADSVNFAARLESLTKQMGASIIVSEDSLKQVGENDHYLKRYMGKIQVVGKSEAIKVYEILNGLPEEELEAKLRNKVILSEGIRCFEEEDMQTALSNFVTVQVDPYNSKIAGLYLLCIEEYYKQQEEFLKRGKTPPKWDGVLKPSIK